MRRRSPCRRTRLQNYDGGLHEAAGPSINKNWNFGCAGMGVGGLFGISHPRSRSTILMSWERIMKSPRFDGGDELHRPQPFVHL